MNSQAKQAKDIFIQLVGKVRPEEWEQHLMATCSDDEEVQHRVRALLRAHVEPGSFLEGPVIPTDATVGAGFLADEEPGTVIGHYKLLEPIGEGGMGTVYMAEQTEPVHRKVALKIIKQGMDTKQVIARFEAERQALAVMDHPNIAKVFDAGTTESGRPYFVMELVKGLPIQKFCDERRLNPKQRLELFIHVCNAVQHAHQKGIIHRDLKPSNIMVAMYDDKPVPKVIDFGVAKATGEQLTEKTMFTRFGQVLGTLEYMSPEQTQLNQLDIDTRSDIYSLGAILYELLSGTPPFEMVTFKKAALDEVFRMIRETEPEKPSNRLSTSKTAAKTAATHNTQTQKLTSLVRGDLDWIVMKALEKDRTRRYETANGFALDIRRYLKDEPVTAGPPSAMYKFRKFASRNKGALAASILVAVSLIIGTGVSSWQAVEATRAKRIAKSAEQDARNESKAKAEESENALRQARIAEEVQKFWNDDVLGQANPMNQSNRDITLREVLDLASKKVEGRFPNEPLVEAAIHRALFKPYVRIGEDQRFEHHLDRARELYRQDTGNHLSTYLNLNAWWAFVLQRRGDFDEARRVLEDNLDLCARLVTDVDDAKVATFSVLADLERNQAHYAKQLDYAHQSLNLLVNKYGSGDARSITALNRLAIAFWQNGELTKALLHFKDAHVLAEESLAPGHPRTSHIAGNLGSLIIQNGDYDEALTYLRPAWESSQKANGLDYQVTIYVGAMLARALRLRGDTDEAENVLLKLLQTSSLTPANEDGPRAALLELATFYEQKRELEKAEKYMRQLLKAQEQFLGAEHRSSLNSAGKLANILISQGKYEDAKHVQERLIDLRKKIFDKSPNDLNNAHWLASDLYRLGQTLKKLNDVQSETTCLRADQHDSAVNAAKQSVEVRRQIARLSPEDLQAQVKLGGQLNDTANLIARIAASKNEQNSPSHSEEKLAMLDEAVEVLTRVVNRNPNIKNGTKFLAISAKNKTNTLFDLQRWDQAIEATDIVLRYCPEKDRGYVEIVRCEALARAGKHKISSKEVERMIAENRVAPEHWPSVASVFCWCSQAIMAAQVTTKTSDVNLSEHYHTRAIDCLETAVSAPTAITSQDLEYVTTSDDFQPLRDRKDFQEVLARMKSIVQSTDENAGKNTSTNSDGSKSDPPPSTGKDSGRKQK